MTHNIVGYQIEFNGYFETDWYHTDEPDKIAEQWSTADWFVDACTEADDAGGYAIIYTAWLDPTWVAYHDGDFADSYFDDLTVKYGVGTDKFLNS